MACSTIERISVLHVVDVPVQISREDEMMGEDALLYALTIFAEGKTFLVPVLDRFPYLLTDFERHARQ